MIEPRSSLPFYLQHCHSITKYPNYPVLSLANQQRQGQSRHFHQLLNRKISSIEKDRHFLSRIKPSFSRGTIDIDELVRSMDPSSVQATPSVEEDEWDTEGFVIPSLSGVEFEASAVKVSEVDSKASSPKATKEEDNIYLGPHGAPPSQVKQQELTGRKQRFKQKLKEADRKFSGSGRENKEENLRALTGSSKGSVTMPKSSPREWLDPHCHESQFERSYSR